MTRRRISRLAPLAPLLLAAAASTAAALEQGPFRLDVLVDGSPLAEHAARGTTYVEAVPGREYSLRLTNRTSRRIAVALAVDGLNTIDAKTTTAHDASKWILGPYESVTIDGWQTGPSTARRFFFTTEEKSYGAWLGKTRDLGLIAAAVFEEKRPHPVPIQRSETKRRGAAAEADAGEAAPSAPAPSDDYAATGIGRELDHRVRRVEFDAADSPAASLALRYEYRDALVRLGVLPDRFEDPLARRERAGGFEGFEFAPDPYRERSAAHIPVEP